MSRLKIFSILFTLCLSSAFAQEDYEAIYDHETLGGINFNTNAGLIGGFMVRHSIFIKDRHYHTFGAEIVNVKHPQEEREISPVTGNTFLYGKENFLLPLRLFYGRTYVLFPKDRDEGVQVDVSFRGGPSLGFLKPYYVVYDFTDYNQANPRTQIQSVPYNHRLHSTDKILGYGSFFAGLAGSRLIPGLHATTSMTFSFINMNGNVTGLEAGINVEAYPQRMNIIPFAQNRWFFSSVFINIIYGRRH
ncbi:MAG: hypothetical protein ACK4ND_08635 [Cytophagaceae bacterium]